MADLIRDSTLGQFVNHLSGGRLLPYADQRPGYVVPSRFLSPRSRPVSVALSIASPKAVEEVKKEPTPIDVPVPNNRVSATFTVIALDAPSRPLSRISISTSPYAEQRRRSTVYAIPSTFAVPGSESEIAFAPIMEPTTKDGPDFKMVHDSEDSLATVEVKRDSIALGLVKDPESSPRTMGFPDVNLVGWDGDDDPDNPRFVLHLSFRPGVPNLTKRLSEIGLSPNVYSSRARSLS